MNIDRLIRTHIKNLEPYSSARDEYENNNEKVVLLDANENPVETEVNRYPDPYQNQLKKVISKVKNVPIEQLVLGNGSDELIDLILTAFVEPGDDEVVLLPPTYGMYKVRAQILGAKIIEIPLTTEFQLPVDEILKQISKTPKLLFICSPNNPTGNAIKAKDIVLMLEKFPGIVVVDEAYIDFSAQDSLIENLGKFENLIVLQTFSKAYGMAGIRLGMAFASSKIVKVLNKIKSPYNISTLTQNYALKALNNNFKLNTASLNRLKQKLIPELLALSMVQKIYPSETNFLLIEVDVASKRYHQLRSLGIIVRDRSNLSGCSNCLRISVGSEEENKKLIKALKTLE